MAPAVLTEHRTAEFYVSSFSRRLSFGACYLGRVQACSSFCGDVHQFTPLLAAV